MCGNGEGLKGPEKAEGSACIRAQRLNFQERSTEGVLEKRVEFIHSSHVGGGCPSPSCSHAEVNRFTPKPPLFYIFLLKMDLLVGVDAHVYAYVECATQKTRRLPLSLSGERRLLFHK